MSDRGRDILDAALTLFAERGYVGTSMKDIAALLGIRAPSLYNHLDSKQDLLRDIMVTTMETLTADHYAAVGTTDDVAEQLRRAMEAHVRYHLRHQRAARVCDADLWHLEQPALTTVRDLWHDYVRSWREIIERGVELRRFETATPELTAHAMLQMGAGVSYWYQGDGPLSEAQIAYHYGDMALRLVSGIPASPITATAAPTPAERPRRGSAASPTG
jgi:AcrR family transcriptional regulator